MTRYHDMHFISTSEHILLFPFILPFIIMTHIISVVYLLYASYLLWLSWIVNSCFFLSLLLLLLFHLSFSNAKISSDGILFKDTCSIQMTQDFMFTNNYDSKTRPIEFMLYVYANWREEKYINCTLCIMYIYNEKYERIKEIK